MTKSNRRSFVSRMSLLTAMHMPLLIDRATGQDEISAVSPVRFKRLILLTKPLDEMKKFYGETLGFRIVEESAGAFSFVAGDTKVEFRRSEGDDEPFYHFAFSIAENKIERAKAWTESRTKVLTQSRTGKQIIRFRNWNADAIYFFDPAGNIGEFIAHHSLDTASQGDFSLDDVLYASEIGLVVDDVPASAKEIQPLVGLNDTRVSRNFAAIGDSRGFFILVPKHRVWLPTDDVQAEPHSVHASFQTHAAGTIGLNCGPFTLDRLPA